MSSHCIFKYQKFSQNLATRIILITDSIINEFILKKCLHKKIKGIEYEIFQSNVDHFKLILYCINVFFPDDNF